jgi:predicted nucleic acid-binding protein
MMELVVDTSVIIAVIANKPEKDRLIELTVGLDLIAPHSVHWEIGNAFSAMLKRGRIDLEQAFKAIEIYRQIPIRYVDVEMKSSLELVDKLAIYAYDAYIILCAMKYRSSLVTLDNSLAITARLTGVKVLEV